MGWALPARSLLPPAFASASADESSRRRRPKPARRAAPHRPKQPSVAEVRRAIGVDSSDDFSSPRNLNSSSSSSNDFFMDLLSNTPIGQAEGPAERMLRQTAEWFADQSEANAKAGQKILIVVCLKILPVWVMLLLLASGAIKLPFDVPFIDDLIS